MVATNEETYGVAGAAFYDGYFPIDEWARTTAAFLAAVARDTGANEPIALELGIGDGTIVETARLDPVAQTIDFEVAVFSPTNGVALHPRKKPLCLAARAGPDGRARRACARRPVWQLHRRTVRRRLDDQRGRLLAPAHRGPLSIG